MRVTFVPSCKTPIALRAAGRTYIEQNYLWARILLGYDPARSVENELGLSDFLPVLLRGLLDFVLACDSLLASCYRFRSIRSGRWATGGCCYSFPFFLSGTSLL